jgi:hypothetical protein
MVFPMSSVSLKCAKARCQWPMEARKNLHCMLSQRPGDAEAHVEENLTYLCKLIMVTDPC